MFGVMALNREKNNEIINALTPLSGLSYDNGIIRIGEIFGKVGGITDYPNSLSLGIDNKYNKVPFSYTTHIFIPENSGLFTKGISKGIRQAEMRELETRDASTQISSKNEARSGRELIEQIQDGDTVGYMINLSMIFGENKEEVKERYKRFENLIEGLQMRFRGMSHLSRQTFKTLAPFYTINNEVEDIFKRNILFSDFCKCFPFGANKVTRQGYYLGVDNMNGLLLHDSWERKNNMNGNMVLIGESGSGKTTACKHILFNEFLIGTKLIIIDPEAEYTEFAKKIRGNVIDLSGESGNIINPLQIRISLDEQNSSKNSYNLHLQKLRNFFKIIFQDITYCQLNLLIEELEKTYKNFNIERKTSFENLDNKDYPTFTDLYNTLKNKFNLVSKSDENYYDYKVILGFIKELTSGIYSNMFNNHTNIDLQNDITVFNIAEVQNVEDNIKKALYYNLLNFCWEQITNNKRKNNNTFLVIDEAHLMLDSRIKDTMITLKTISKRCRKYNANLMIITHSLVDMLDNELRKEGQGILENANYKILLGTDGKNLEESQNIFKLTEQELDILAVKKKGSGIFIAGNLKTPINFKILKYEKEFVLEKENTNGS